MTEVCEVTYLMVLRRGALIVGDAGHKGGLTNPCPWRGQCRAGFSNTSGPPKSHSEGAASKKVLKSQLRLKYKARDNC